MGKEVRRGVRGQRIRSPVFPNSALRDDVADAGRNAESIKSRADISSAQRKILVKDIGAIIDHWKGALKHVSKAS